MLTYVKLVNGEELVGEMQGDVMVPPKIGKPVQLMRSAQMTASGPAISINLIPYPSQEIELGWDKILFRGEPDGDLVAAYTEKIGGVAIAPASLLAQGTGRLKL